MSYTIDGIRSQASDGRIIRSIPGSQRIYLRVDFLFVGYPESLTEAMYFQVLKEHSSALSLDSK